MKKQKVLRDSIYRNLEVLIQYNQYEHIRFKHGLSESAWLQHNYIRPMGKKGSFDANSISQNEIIGYILNGLLNDEGGGGLLYVLKVCDLAEKFKRNDEFLTIDANLKNSGIDEKYRHEKLFSIYHGTYDNEIDLAINRINASTFLGFGHVYVQSDSRIVLENTHNDLRGKSGFCYEFFIFSNAVSYLQFLQVFEENNHFFSNMFEKYCDLSNDIFVDCKIQDVILNLDNPQLRECLNSQMDSFNKANSGLYATLCSIAEHRLKKEVYNGNLLRKIHSGMSSHRNINFYLYIAFAKHISRNYDSEQLLRLILDAPSVIEVLDEKQRIYEADLERKRLLSGDLTYEKNLVAEKLALESVKDGIGFEKYLIGVFSRLGYDVLETAASGDRGAGLVLMQNNVKYIIQAKFHTKPVGNKAIQEVYSGKDIYKAQIAAVVTNNTFTKQATEDASSLNVVLVNGEKLKVLIDALAKGEFLDVFQ